MKRTRYTNEQITLALRQAESGMAVEEICRLLSVSESTLSRCKKPFAGMGVAEIRRLKPLEEENAKRKWRAAGLMLGETMLQDGLLRAW